MHFGEALEALKNDESVSREGWYDGMWVALSPGFTLTSDRVFAKPIQNQIGDGVGLFRPYLMMRTANDEYVPWQPSQADILAEDWQVVPSK